MQERLTFENTTHSKDPLLSCALEGVASIVAGIRDVCMVIHSPQGCASTVNAAYDKHEMDLTMRKIGCTRLFESDIIMGASAKLEHIIRKSDENFKSRVMFVVGTCSADIIGEDIKAVCRTLQPEINATLIPIVAGGFRGNSNTGMDLGLDALIPLIEKSPFPIKNTVNLIAPQASSNPSWQADLIWVKNVLSQLGITVLTTFTYDTSLEEIARAGSAQANIILSHETGYKFAKRMQEEFNVPLIAQDIPLPIGMTNTARWLRGVSEYFGVRHIADQIIAAGENQAVSILRKRALMMIPRYRNLRIALSSDMTFGVGLIRMLFEELEMIPELLIYKSSSPQGEKILEAERAEMGITPDVVIDADGYQVKESLKGRALDAIVGSAWEKYIAEELEIKLAFDVFSPTNRVLYVNEPYLGYDGMLYLLQAFAGDFERTFRSKHIEWDD